MKKVLTGILAVVLIILLVSPAVVGWVVEDQLTVQIEAANQNPALQIEKHQYRRGWLTSHAELRIKVQRPEGNSVVVAAVDLHHGPLPVSVLFIDGIKFQPSILIAQGDVLLEQLAIRGIQSPEKLPPLQLLATLNFDQSVAYRCNHAGGKLSFTRPNQAAALLDWQAGNCDGAISAKTGTASSNVFTAGIEFKDGPTDLEITDLALNFDIDLAKSTGYISSRLSSLNGRIKHGDFVDPIAANNVKLEGQLTPNGKKANALLQLKTTAFTLRDFELTGGSTDIAVNRLPRSLLKLGKSSETNSDGEAQEATPAIRAAMASAELLIKQFSGTLKQGAIELTGQADVNALNSNTPITLETVLQSLRGSVNIVADEPLVGFALSNYAAPRIGDLWYTSSAAERDALRAEIQNSQQKKLIELLQSGWLKAEGGRFRSDIDYADGLLTVNGNKISDQGDI